MGREEGRRAGRRGEGRQNIAKYTTFVLST